MQDGSKELFGDSIDVTLVELDVLVRDPSGVPVRGLRAEDFRVLENGEPRPIGGFSERTNSDHETVAQGSAPSEQDTVGRLSTLVVFLDHAALRPDRRARVLSSLRRYIATEGKQLAGASTKLALVTNDQPLQVRIQPTASLDIYLEQLDLLPPPPASSARSSLDPSSSG